MKEIKMNTIPCGKPVVIIFFIAGFSTAISAITFIIIEGIFYDLSIGLLFVTILQFFGVLFLLSLKYWNSIYISDFGVRYKKKFFNWSDIYISVSQSKPLGGPDYTVRIYFYFNNRFLTCGEEKTKSIRKEGFYLVATATRAYQILSKYNKEVKMLCNFNQYTQKLVGIIKKHNQKITQVDITQ